MLARFIVGAILTAVGLALQGVRPLPLGAATPGGSPDRYAVPQGGVAEYPAVEIPAEYRVHNWAPYGSGSCVHASMVMLFNWQGLPEVGTYWRQQYHSGETFSGLARKLEQNGIAWAGVNDGDVSFLEWALRTRRGCAVTVEGGAHMVCLVHLDELRAGILDNNSPGRITWTSRDAFLTEWRNSSGWGVTPVYDPPPRRPFLKGAL